jgi:hypothetical protein
MFRLSCAAAVTLIMACVAMPDTASAQFNRPWCSQGRIGSMTPDDCSFNTLAQCRAAVSGTSRSCTRNLQYQDGQKKRKRAPRYD